MQIIVLIFSILLKYIPGTTGYKTRLVINADDTGFDLPFLSLEGPIKVKKKDIETFKSALDATEDSKLNPLFFVSFTTPLLLYVLASHSCPIRPLGSVNTRNRFDYKDAAFCQDQQAILSASNAGELSYTCQFGGKQLPGHRRKRGVEFDIVVEVKRKCQEVVLVIHFSALQFLPKTYLPRFHEKATSESIQTAAPPPPPFSEKEAKGVFKTMLHIKSNHPRRWAASCSDFNPIHCFTLAAKMFGFPSVIAHGNLVVALAIQQTLSSNKGTTSEQRVLDLIWESKDTLDIKVDFVRPIILPADLTVCWQRVEKNKVELEIFSKDRTCVNGHLSC